MHVLDIEHMLSSYMGVTKKLNIYILISVWLILVEWTSKHTSWIANTYGPATLE